MYGKLEKGILQYAPKNYINNLGQLIVNFNNSELIMKQYGYKEVIDIRPAFDETTQYLHVINYNESEDKIVVEYEVIDKEEQVQKTTLDERVTNLEERLNVMTIIFNDEVNK